MTEHLIVQETEKRFGEQILFSNVSFNVRQGEIVSVIGESGVGKTTLLRMIAGLTPFAGHISIAGERVGGQASPKDNHRLVLVTQHANLWDHLCARDNVALVRRVLRGESKKAARRKADQYLASLQVEGVGNRFPASLSGGEQQRVSLARGLAAETPLLLLDEITSNIDPVRRQVVADTMSDLAAAGRCIVFVTHDLSTAQLVGGRIFELTARGVVERASAARDAGGVKT